MVVWISRKRAGHVTDPPVSRALSSLQWLIVKFVDIGMQIYNLWHAACSQSSKCRTVRTCHYRPYQNRESKGITLHAIRLQMFPDNEHNWDLRSSAIVLSEDSYRRFGTTYHPRKTEDLIYTAAEAWSLSRNIIIKKNHAVNVRKLQVHVTVHH